MKQLFEEITLGGIRVKNRIVRSATMEAAGDQQGRYDQKMFDLYEDLAKGGVGTIISGMIGIDENSRTKPEMIDGWNETFVEQLHKLTEMVHSYGAKLVIQIAHAGRMATQVADGLPPLAPSALEGVDCREMSREYIHSIVENFAAIAARCKEAGADGVQIHSAHGYLLTQFLCPRYNHRTDEYGGSIENRARIHFEIYEAIRAAVGPDYPVWIKINSHDRIEDGLTVEEFLWVSKQLDAMGIDSIEVSGGLLGQPATPWNVVRKEEDEAFFFAYAKTLAESVQAAVISVGGYRTPALAEKLLNESKVEAISLCRPLLCEPDLINRWKNGGDPKPRCVSCNLCFKSPSVRMCMAFNAK